MTDYFTQWCVGLELETPEQTEWLQDVMVKLKRYTDLLSDVGDDSEDPQMVEIKQELGELTEILGENSYLTFTLKYELTDGIGDVYFDADEIGDTNQISALLQQFLKKFRPDGCIGIEWAHTCSRSQTDGFGGGAAFITAEKIEALDTRNWLYEKEQEFEKK